MKITGRYHLTATERRHIAQLIESGEMIGRSKRKAYELQATPGGFSGMVYTSEQNDRGEPITRRQSFTVDMR